MINQKIRFCDIFFSIIILIIFSPIMLFISIFIFIIDGKPIFFKQIRIGYKGKSFVIFKFRTMSKSMFKNEKLRLTFIGKFLRKTSLDELPQFINVLKKDMSIVGPRPLPKIIENKIKFSLKIKRRSILPGITGMSQINYTGKKRILSEKINLDVKFVNDYTLNNYLQIIFKTPAVLIVRLFKNKSSIIK